jgi:hypothetical protein
LSFSFATVVGLAPVKRTAVIPSEFSRRHSDAASNTRSLSRNWPTSPEIAGKPPAAGAATPGVLAKNVQVRI